LLPDWISVSKYQGLHYHWDYWTDLGENGVAREVDADSSVEEWSTRDFDFSNLLINLAIAAIVLAITISINPFFHYSCFWTWTNIQIALEYLLVIIVNTKLSNQSAIVRVGVVIATAVVVFVEVVVVAIAVTELIKENSLIGKEVKWYTIWNLNGIRCKSKYDSCLDG
jgi:hypothetical protein